MAPSQLRTQRPPQARRLRNDARLLDAAVATAADEGWSGLTFLRVAERTGLSRRTLQDRFAGPKAMIVAVWSERVGVPLQAALTEVLRAGGQLGDAPSDDDVLRALDQLARPGSQLRAAAELLLLAQFEADLFEAVASSLGVAVEQWCTPGADTTRALAARRHWLLLLALGLLYAGRRPGVETLDLHPAIAPMLVAVRAGAEPVVLPKVRAAQLEGFFVPESNDPITDALRIAVLEQVGRSGYDGASTERIAAAAGVSRGALFSHYATKLDLFVDAARVQQGMALRANEAYQRRIHRQHGRGVAEAVAVREFERPHRAPLRACTMELIRLSWHDPRMGQIHAQEMEALFSEARQAEPGGGAALEARLHLEYALGLGCGVLPLLCPDCWKLPHDVVTVPLYG